MHTFKPRDTQGFLKPPCCLVAKKPTTWSCFCAAPRDWLCPHSSLAIVFKIFQFKMGSGHISPNTCHPLPSPQFWVKCVSNRSWQSSILIPLPTMLGPFLDHWLRVFGTSFACGFCYCTAGRWGLELLMSPG